MKLIPASGSPRMQRAFSHLYVRTIVAIVLQQSSTRTGLSYTCWYCMP